jgi:hypothetical protein
MIPSTPPAIVSQSFTDRFERLTQRVTDDAAKKLLAPGQEPLLRAQLAAAKTPDQLDVIDRQLAEVDFTLALPEDGRAIVVHVGDDVTVAMRDPYLWSVQGSDMAALAPHVGIMYVRGVQGVYAAKKPGIVTLMLTANTPGASPAPPPTIKQPVVFTVVILSKNER